MIQQGTALEHNALSIQCRSYPRAEVCEVTNALASGRPVPTHLAEKYRLFTLDPTGTALVLANRTLVTTEDQDATIEAAYKATYAGINRLHAYLMSRHWGVKQSRVTHWLARSAVQQQHRHQPSYGSTKPRVVKELNAIWQLDLLHFKEVPVLVVVDLWSKYCRVAILRNKEAATVARALHRMFEHATPRAISCDNGTEFHGAVSTMLREGHIRQIFGHPGQPTSQASAERIIRTIRMALERYLTGGGQNWRQFLPEWVAAYNEIKHRSTAFPPSTLQTATAAQKQHVAAVRGKQIRKLLAKRKHISLPDLQVGDRVRVRILRKSGIEKKSLPQYSAEIHRVGKIIRSKYNWSEYKLDNKKIYRRDYLLKIPAATTQTPTRPRYRLPDSTHLQDRLPNARQRKQPSRLIEQT